MSDETKPYDYQGPALVQGDPIGWVDAEGQVHIETFKAYGRDGIEIFEVEGRTAGQIAAVAAFIEHGRDLSAWFVE